MVESVLKVLEVFWVMIKYPLYFILFIICLFSLLVFIFVVIDLIKGRRFIKSENANKKKYKKRGFLKKVFVDLPKQYKEDLFNMSPDFFKPQGLIIFEGKQGAGKTVAMVEYAMRLKELYPLSISMSNFCYKYENSSINHWRDFIEVKNGIFGIVCMLDELQNWFSSNDSRNFPPEMLDTISQNRKNRRTILGTTQNFHLLAKPIRTQTVEVRRCATLLGCVTIVRRAEPFFDSAGEVKKWKGRGIYFFVHNKKIRDAYDTYKVIENLTRAGFKKERDINYNER